MIYTINKITDIPKLKFNNLIIGFFDGLHQGHKKLFLNHKDNSAVLTFDFNKKNADKLFSLSDRINIIQDVFEIKDIIVLNLNECNLTANEFIHDFLTKLEFNKIIVGKDFKFGLDQKKVNYLSKFYNVVIIDRDTEAEISTSKIKKLITNGLIEEANKELLMPYYYKDKVIFNTQKARLLGYPTANFEVDNNRAIPADGIYITKTIFNNQWYSSVTFIGIPKYKNHKSLKHFETHLIDYSGPEFYGQIIKVIFYKKIGEVKLYNNVEDLIAGIKSQVEQAKKFFK